MKKPLSDDESEKPNKTPRDARTGADLIAALQASPYRDMDIEPERYRVLNPLPPSKLDWLKQQRLRLAEVFRRFHKRSFVQRGPAKQLHSLLQAQSGDYLRNGLFTETIRSEGARLRRGQELAYHMAQ